MIPRGFFFEEDRKKDKTAKIIYGADKIPFFFGEKIPKIEGRVMFDKFAKVIDDNPAVVRFFR